MLRQSLYLQTMTTASAPTVVSVSIEFAADLFDVEFMLRASGGSALATFEMSDGSTETFSWYHEEISFTSGAFAGKTIAEIRQLHYDRDLAYLRA